MALCKHLETEIKKYKEVPLRWWQDKQIDAQVSQADEQTKKHIQYMIDKFTAKIESLESLLQKHLFRKETKMHYVEMVMDRTTIL